MLKFSIFLLHVILMTSQVNGADKSSQPIYTEHDDVIVLDADNFHDEMLNSTNSWFVMFYSRWCGHCKEFAPTYKRLATDMKGWRKQIKLAAVDCSAKSEKTSKDNGMKICFKKPYFIGGMPDCRLFPPFSDTSTKGVRRKFLGKKTYGSDGKLKEDSDSYENVFSDILNLLQDHHQSNDVTMEFIKKKDMEEILEKFNKFVLIIEPRSSIVGKLITLDVANEREDVKVGRISNRNKKSLSIIEQQYNLQIQQSQITAVIKMTSSVPKMVYFNQDPDDFRKRVVDEIRNHQDENMTSHDDDDVSDDNDVTVTSNDAVLMSQLEMALHYTLRKEIAGKEIIKHRNLGNLKNFLNTIIQFFPGRKKTMKFVRKVRKLIRNKDYVEWEDWQDVLRRAKYTVGSFLSTHEDYNDESCSSFPCCFWQLFHVIMTQYYRTAPDMDPLIILKSMSGYMESFFTCQNCQENWKYETDDMDDFVDDASSALLYLWKKHNSVNRRLGKKSWPSMEICPSCWDGQVYDLDEVEKFLAEFYHFEKISLKGAREEEDEEEEDEDDVRGGGREKDEL